MKASIDFESSFTSVRKTVEATEAEFADPAAAFQAFIIGLAQMDEEGESAPSRYWLDAVIEKYTEKLEGTDKRTLSAKDLIAYVATDAEALTDDSTRFYDKNGIEIPMTAVSQEAVATMRTVVDEVDQLGVTMAGRTNALSGYDFSAAGRIVGSHARNAVANNLTSSTIRSIGVNAMSGLTAGINAGKFGVA